MHALKNALINRLINCYRFLTNLKLVEMNTQVAQEIVSTDLLSQIDWFGRGLSRPECVLTNSNGDMFTADWRGNGGVAHTRSDGSSVLYEAHTIDGEAMRPNGIALLADGSFLLTHLGAEQGGVFQLFRDGRSRLFLRTVQGVDLPPTNYVVQDQAGRTWITVSTRLTPRSLGYRASCDDGFVVLVDGQGARIVADGLGYTNECALDPSGEWLYVNETFGRKLSRFAIRANGDLGPKELVTRFGHGVFPDGLAFDVAGNVWVVSIVSNRVIRVSPDGNQHVWLDDSDPEHLSWVEVAYHDSALGRPHLDGVKSKVLKNISSLAFGGKDLQTGYLGCLLGDSVARLRMPVAGHAPTHWHY
jgi:SMP-30/Gluconolactonase/LRE-like region